MRPAWEERLVKIALVNIGNPAIRPEDEEEHLGLGYLAAVARRDGHEVRLVDATSERLSASKVVAAALPSDVVGVSVIFQETIPAAMALIQSLRQAGFGGHVVIGGHPPTFLYEELTRDYAGGKSTDGAPGEVKTGGGAGRSFDSIAVGEAEETFAALLRALDTGEDWRSLPGLLAVKGVAPSPAASPACPASRPLVADLDSLPFPARDTLPLFLARRPGPRVASVLRSRGCYGTCSFCDTRAFYAASPGAAWRVRSAGNVVDELEQLVADHGLEAIRFWDDNFMGPGQRGREAAEDLGRQLIRRRDRGLPKLRFSFECRVTDVDPDLFGLLKEAGLHRLFLGVEAMTQRQLDFLGKRVLVEDNRRALTVLDDLGLDVVIGMIMFDPDTTVAELEGNLAFLRESFGGWGSVRAKVARPWNRLEVYAGTPMAETLRQQGRLKGSYVRYSYDFADPVVSRIYTGGSLLRRVGLPIRDTLSRLRRKA
jgi:anaerobic magnesium-protoporphyrin IX monomethyl ester cyclase